MNVLLKKVIILSSSSPYHRQTKDIHIIDGIIQSIEDNITDEKAEQIAHDNMHVSIGWMDIFADFAEPGNEHRETIETGTKAAAAGGFTDVMLMPNTDPVVSSKTQVEFLKQRSALSPVTIHPIGAITKNAEGNELSEMYDMHASGAVAFSDGKKPVQQSGILLKAMQYALAKDAVIIQLPDDSSISSGGLMNEGISSTQFGLPGIPAIAEEIMIARDLSLLQYTGSKLHITGVSSKKGLELINQSKKEGFSVTCSVTPYHLTFCDEDLENYNTYFKVNPPLRTCEDMHAIQAALRNGEIDCIASHHIPQCADDKICEFEYAKNGMITLQTLFGSVNRLMNDTEALVKILSENCRRIFSIEIPVIAEGEKACLTIFDPAKEFIFDEKDIVSRSKNTAFAGIGMKGKVIGIINKNQLVLNEI